MGEDLTSTFSRAAQSYCHLSAAPNHSPAGPRPGSRASRPASASPLNAAGRLPSPGSRSAGAKGRPHAARRDAVRLVTGKSRTTCPAASQSSGGESTTEPPRRRAKAVLPLAVMVPRLHLNKPLGRDPPSPAAAVRCSGQDPARSMPLHRGRSVPVGEPGTERRQGVARGSGRVLTTAARSRGEGHLEAAGNGRWPTSALARGTSPGRGSSERTRTSSRHVNGQRDFPVGGQLISLLADT